MVTQSELEALLTTNLKIWQHDTFLSSEQLQQATNQTGYVTVGLQDALLDTGVQALSYARLNYFNALFNPLYGKLLLKLHISSKDNVFAFFGFKKTLDAPAFDMTESHAGFILYNGALYFSTGDGAIPSAHQQRTVIQDCDVTRWLVFKVEENKGMYYSLPYTVPFFDKDVLPGLKQGIIRKWSPVYQNGAVRPEDVAHYLVFFIRNSVGASKQMRLQFINYSEVYPD